MKRLLTVFVSFLLISSALTSGITVAPVSAQTTSVLDDPEQTTTISPGDGESFVEGGIYSAIVTVEVSESGLLQSSSVDRPKLNLSLSSSNGDASVVEVATDDYTTTPEDVTTACTSGECQLTSDSAFAGGTVQTVLVQFYIDQQNPPEEITLTADPTPGQPDTTEETVVAYSVTESVNSAETMARTADARAELAAGYNESYNRLLYNDPWDERFEQSMREASTVLANDAAQSIVTGYADDALAGVTPSGTANNLQTLQNAQTAYGMSQESYGDSTVGKLARINNELYLDLKDRAANDEITNNGNASYALEELARLSAAEAEAWRDGDRERVRRILQQKLLVIDGARLRGIRCGENVNRYDCNFKQGFDSPRDASGDDPSLLTQATIQKERAEQARVNNYFGSVISFAESEREYINTVAFDLARDPAPSVSTESTGEDISQKLAGLETDTDETVTVKFTVSNAQSGGITSSQGYLSVSHAESLELVGYTQTSDGGEAIVRNSSVGEDISYADGTEKPAKYNLTDILEQYEPGETNTYELEFKRVSDDAAWITYRAAFEPLIHDSDSGDTFVRYPTQAQRAQRDQQNFPAFNITETVSETDNQAPIATIDTAQTSVEAGESITFDSTPSTDNKGIDSRTWQVYNATDGTELRELSATPQPTETFSEPGVREVQLTVTDAAGNSDTASINVTVVPTTQLAPGISSNRSVIEPNTPTELRATVPDGNYAWDLDGDGSYDDATGRSVRWHPSSAGEYDIGLEVTANGQQETVRQSYAVESAAEQLSAPTPVVDAPTTLAVGETGTFDASDSTDQAVDDSELREGSIADYEWDFDDDGTVDATGATVSKSFDSAGSYTVTLTLTDNDGYTTFAQFPITVNKTGPNHGSGEFVDVSPSDLAGDGTESDPYEISNVSELQAMEDDPEADYMLATAIDASNTAQWNDGKGFDPVNKFTGSLDGNNNTINGLHINRPTGNNIGLFGVNEGVISDVSLNNSTVYGSVNVGGIAGWNKNGGIYSVITSGNITGDRDVGGVVGQNGWDRPNLNNPNAPIKNSTASVNINGGSDVGGLVGRNFGYIKNTKASGNVTGGGETGGLVGSNNDGGTIQNAKAVANVTGNSAVGGLVGYNDGKIQQTLAVGVVNSSGGGGGLVAKMFDFSEGTVANSYWDTQATGQDSSAGSATGLTTTQMQGQAAATNMSGFEYGTVWQTQSDGYPVLLAQSDSDQENSDDDQETSEDTEPPVARATASSISDRQFQLIGNQSSDNVNISTYEWDTDNDGVYEVTGQSPTVSYQQPGAQTIELRVTDPSGNSDTDTTNVTVANSPPTVEFTTEPDVFGGGSVQLEGSVSDPNDDPLTYSWRVINGTGNITETGPTGRYTAPSGLSENTSATVQLTVSDGSTSSSATVDVDVLRDVPTASIDRSTWRVQTNTAVQFDASRSTDLDGEITEYLWDFDGDGLVDKTGPRPTYVFDQSGPRRINLTVTDTDDTSGTTRKTLYVSAESAWHGWNDDPANTGMNPATGVDGPVTQRWNTSIGASLDETASPPVVVNDTIYVTSTPNVYAINATTGTIRWRDLIEASLSAPTVANGSVYVSGVNPNTGSSLYAFDAETGDTKWSVSGSGSTFQNTRDRFKTPVVAGNTVFVSSHTIDESSSYNTDTGRLYAFDAKTGSERWNEPLTVSGTLRGGDVSMPSVENETVFVSQLIWMHAFDAQTGSKKWTASTENNLNLVPDSDRIISHAVSDGHIYAGSYTGETYAFDTATGNVQWTSGEDVGRPSPAATTDSVYFSTNGSEVTAVDTETGSTRWQTSLGSGVTVSAPTVVNNTVYVMSDDGTLYALDQMTGRIEWTYLSDIQSEVSPTVVNGSLYLGGNTGTVSAISSDPDRSGEDTDTAASIIAPPDFTYNPASPLTVGTGHNAAGVIASDNVAVRLVNATDGNETAVARNDSIPVEGDVNTTITANAISGNVTIEAQLYNAVSGRVVATDTVNLTVDQGRSGEGGERALVVDATDDSGYATIQSAVDAADDGDTVEIRPGTYSEELVIKDNITLVAPDGATLSGPTSDPASVSDGAGIQIVPDTQGGPVSPTIRGITIDGYYYGLFVGGGGSSVVGDFGDEATGDWRLENTTIQNSGAQGIEASEATGDWRVLESRIEQTVFEGIYADGATGEWVVKDTTVTQTGRDGILARNTEASWELRNVTVRNSSEKGVEAGFNDADWVIRNSSVENNGGDDFSNIAGIGVLGTSGDWLITDSRITNNAGVGIDLEPGDQGIDPVSGNWTVTNSRIFGNDGGINARTAAMTGSATRNYWGAPDGPAGDFDGSGDAAIGNVTVSPYYEDRALTELASFDDREDAPEPLSVTRSAVEFGTVSVSDSSVERLTIVNNASTALDLETAMLTGNNTDQFTVESNVTGAIPAATTRTINVTFAPTTAGESTARLTLSTARTELSPPNVSLSGSGTPTTSLTLTANESSVVAGDPVRFTVTDDEGTPVNATIKLPDTTVSTGSDGNVTVRINTVGRLEATATKGTEASTSAPLPITVVEPTLTIVDSTIEFGTISVDNATQATITLRNDNAIDIPVERVGLVGGDTGEFAVDETTVPDAIAANSNHTVTVAFVPTTRGDATATLDIADRTVALTGAGVAPTVTATSELPIEGTTQQGSSTTATLTISNDGGAALNATLSTTDDAFTHPDDIEIDPGATESLDIQFTPDSGDTGTISAALTITPESSAVSPLRIPVVGTVVEREIGLRRATVEFGTTTVGDTTSTTVIVDNTGTTSENLTASTDSPAFTIADEDSDPFTLAPGDSERVTVETNVSTAGSYTADLTVENETDGSVSDTARLNATAEAPALTVDASDPVDFSDTPVNSTSTAEIQLRNEGTAPLRVSLAEAFNTTEADQFSIVGETNIEIPANNTRNITVGFRPQRIGAATATLSLETNDIGATAAEETISLKAAAFETDLELAEDIAVFGTVGVGSSETQTLTLENTGSSLDLTTTTTPTDEFEVSSVPETLPSNENTEVAVTFTPTANASRTGSLTITGEDDTGNTTTVSTSLAGTGEYGELRISQPTLRTGVTTPDGTTTGSVRVSNPGPDGTTLTIDTVSIDDGQFSPASGLTEGETLGGGTTDALDVTFDPDSDAENGAYRAELTLTASSGERTITRTLPVTGTVSTPEPTVSTETIDVGTVDAGREVGRTVTVSNDGGEPFSIEDITTDSTGVDAQRIGQAEVVPGGESTIAIAVNRSSSGPVDATVTITTTDEDQTVSVTGDAVAPELNVPATSVEFDNTSVGSASQAEVQIRNTGNTSLTVAEPVIEDRGNFSVLSGDGQIRIAADSSQNITVGFTPLTDGRITGTLRLEPRNDPTDTDGIREISLGGTGTTANATLNESAVGFGYLSQGETVNRSLTVRNDGTEPLAVTGTSILGADADAFTVRGLDSAAIDAGESETFTVEVNTTGKNRGSLSSRLVIATDASDVTSYLGGTVAAPDIEVPSSVDADRFGTTRLGATSRATVRINNTGNAPLNVTNLRVTGTDADGFSVVGAPANTVISAQDTGRVVVEFDPEAVPNAVTRAQNTPLSATATLNISSDDPDATEQFQTISLAGDAATPRLDAPRTFRFGDVPIGEAVSGQLTVQNTPSATAPVNITGVEVSGADAGDYEATLDGPNTPMTLQAGESVPIQVTLTPSSSGQKYATLSVATNGSRQPVRKVGLSNTETVYSVDYGSVNVTYFNPSSGQEPTVNVDDGLQDRNATLRAVNSNVSTTEDYAINYTFDAPSAVASGNELSRSTGTALRYIEAETTADRSNFTESTIQLTVSKAALDNQDTPPANTTIYHDGNDDGTYDAVETELLFETPQGYVYEGTVESYSTLVIAGDASDLGDGSDGTDEDGSDGTDEDGSDGTDEDGSDGTDEDGNDGTDEDDSGGGGGAGGISPPPDQESETDSDGASDGDDDGNEASETEPAEASGADDTDGSETDSDGASEEAGEEPSGSSDSADDQPDSASPEKPEEQPGFSIRLALAALFGAALLARRRNMEG